MMRLTVEQVLKLHSMMVEETGGESGVRDEGMLDMSISGAYQTFDGQEVYPTVEEKAARMAYSIVRNHPFVDGNKRTGLFVMLVFLELHGTVLNHTQQELVELGLGLAEGKIAPEKVLEWILAHKI